MPKFEVTFKTKGVYQSSTAAPVDIIRSSNTSSTDGSYWTETWAGTEHQNIQAITVANSILHCRKWTYGSGSINRPNSRAVLFYIKY